MTATYKVMHDLLEELKSETGTPYAYYEFKEPVNDDNFIAYFESDKIPHYADNKVYTYDHGFAVELYTKIKNPTLEQKLIDLLEKYELPWSGGETVKVDAENIFMTAFYC